MADTDQATQEETKDEVVTTEVANDATVTTTKDEAATQEKSEETKAE